MKKKSTVNPVDSENIKFSIFSRLKKLLEH